MTRAGKGAAVVRADQLPPPESPRKQRDTEPNASAQGKGDAKPKAAVFQQHRDFVTHWHRELRGAEQTVWHYLWSVAHRDGRMFHVGRDTIANRTDLNERTVRRCIEVLESRGVLEVERKQRYCRGQALGFRIPARLPTP
jgi:hypothetical protein